MSLPVITNDSTFRRQGRKILIASIGSLIPYGQVIDPSIWGAGNSDYTWGRVQKFFARLPNARRYQLPMHYYGEQLGDDFVVYAGLPLTNQSWFLAEAVEAGVLPISFLDDILIVIQENFSLETLDTRFLSILAHSVISPILRSEGFSLEDVVFFESQVNRERVDSDRWNYRFTEPRYCDPRILRVILGNFEKR